MPELTGRNAVAAEPRLHKWWTLALSAGFLDRCCGKKNSPARGRAGRGGDGYSLVSGKLSCAVGSA